MQKVGQVLKSFDPTKDKYISREFQAYGVQLSETLDDYKHKSLYIKLAKTVPRALLEKALTFASDSKADNKGALFMWKLKQLKLEAKKHGRDVVIASEAPYRMVQGGAKPGSRRYLAKQSTMISKKRLPRRSP